MQLTALFVFDDGAERVADGVQECGLADTRIADQRYFEPEMVVVVFLKLRQATSISDQLHVLLRGRHHAVLLATDSILAEATLVNSNRQQRGVSLGVL